MNTEPEKSPEVAPEGVPTAPEETLTTQDSVAAVASTEPAKENVPHTER